MAKIHLFYTLAFTLCWCLLLFDSLLAGHLLLLWQFVSQFLPQHFVWPILSCASVQRALPDHLYHYGLSASAHYNDKDHLSLRVCVWVFDTFLANSSTETNFWLSQFVKFVSHCQCCWSVTKWKEKGKIKSFFCRLLLFVAPFVVVENTRSFCFT